MRPIKFRAWDKELKEMEYDVQDNTDYETDMFPDMLHSKRYVVMQFTGLKDKNGKEIYEGDIVRHGIFGNKVVCWHEWKGAWYVSPTTDPSTVDKDYFIDRQDDNFCEIIGNIYENPALLTPTREQDESQEKKPEDLK